MTKYGGFDNHSYWQLMKKTSIIFLCLCAADLTLLSFFSKDVTDQSLLKNFLFDQKVPKTSGWEGLVVLCSERKNIWKKRSWHHTSGSTMGSYDTFSPQQHGIWSGTACVSKIFNIFVLCYLENKYALLKGKGKKILLLLLLQLKLCGWLCT